MNDPHDLRGVRTHEDGLDLTTIDWLIAGAEFMHRAVVAVAAHRARPHAEWAVDPLAPARLLAVMLHQLYVGEGLLDALVSPQPVGPNVLGRVNP